MTSRKYGLLSVALIFLLAAVIQYFTLTCPDIAWLTWSTEQILAGATPYRDVIEINPPLIYALYAPPIILAQVLNMSAVITLKIYVAMLAAGSAILSARIISRSPLWAGRNEILIGLAALLLLTPNSFITFGQREHLLIIFTLPYVLLNLPSIPARAFPLWLRVSIGLLAGIGFCIKPYFFVIWLAVMAHRWSRKKMLMASDLLIPGIALLYLAAIVYLTPDYFTLLSVAGRAFRAWHGNWTHADLMQWFARSLLIGLAVATMAGLFRKAPDDLYRHDVRYLSLLTAAGFVEALLQFNSWGYILFPFVGLGLLALLYPLLLRPWNRLAAALILAGFFVPFTPWMDGVQLYYRAINTRFLEQLGADDASPGLYYVGLYMAPPQWYRDKPPLRWQSRFPWEGFPLAGIMEASPDTGLPILQRRPGMEKLEHFLQDALADDLQEKRPGLIVMEERGFDFPAWFAQNSQLSDILKHYARAKDMRLCDDSQPAICVNYQIFHRAMP